MFSDPRLCCFHSPLGTRVFGELQMFGHFLMLPPGKRGQENTRVQTSLIFFTVYGFPSEANLVLFFLQGIQHRLVCVCWGGGQAFGNKTKKGSILQSTSAFLLMTCYYSPEAKKHVAYYIPGLRNQERKIQEAAINTYLKSLILPYSQIAHACVVE